MDSLRLLLVDNYDSFVYNIAGILSECWQRLDFEVEYVVCRNDNIPFGELDVYDAVIISPGPGLPSEANDLMKVAGRCVSTHPMLGICLGFQALVECFGGRIVRLSCPRHGHRSMLCGISPDDRLFAGIEEGSAAVGRYHSWVADEECFPRELAVTSRDEDGNIMSFSHVSLPVYGVQFHPESYISNCGCRLIANFLAEAYRIKMS